MASTWFEIVHGTQKPASGTRGLSSMRERDVIKWERVWGALLFLQDNSGRHHPWRGIFGPFGVSLGLFGSLLGSLGTFGPFGKFWIMLGSFWLHFEVIFRLFSPIASQICLRFLSCFFFSHCNFPSSSSSCFFYRAREKCKEVNKTQKRRCQVCILHPNIFLSLPNLPFLFSFLPPPPVSLRMRVSNSASVFITNGLFPIVRFLNLSRAI